MSNPNAFEKTPVGCLIRDYAADLVTADGFGNLSPRVEARKGFFFCSQIVSWEV